MKKEADSVPSAGVPTPISDPRDRILLSLLSKDASLSYADLGEKIALSAPATHERVKRLKRNGTIRRTIVEVDPIKVGRPVLAFVQVETEGWCADGELVDMVDEPAVEEVHAVAGDTCVMLKVRCEDAQTLTDFLERLHAISGVRRTRSHIVLSTYLERGPQVALG